MDFCFCCEEGKVKLSGNLTMEEMNALKYLYCGEKSKATLIATYFYQLYLLELNNIYVKEKLRFFLFSEIESMTMIKQAIEYFGENSAFYRRQGFWRAKWMNFEIDVESFLKNDLLLEKECIIMMISLCKKTKNGSLKDFLRKLIADEALNMRILEDVISKIEKE